MNQTERFDRIAIGVIEPSKTNPRTHFDDAYLADLAMSIGEKGIIEPIIVRQIDAGSHKPMKFEIVAGECRWRAAKMAGLLELPSVVRQYTDEQVLEIQLEENIHRKNLRPLEEASGYRRLIAMNPDKHSAATIATRVGMSQSYVWDYLKLNDLIPEAKKLLDAEKIGVKHAILVSRQKPADQERIINPNNELLFVPLEHGLQFDGIGDPQEKPGKYDDVKAVSVRELEAAIAHHIRFDVAHAAKAAPLVFGETAQKVEAAAAQPGRGKKVIAITFAHGASDDAKDPTERTYGRPSWRLADGTKKTTPVGGFGNKQMKDSPICEFSVLGTVVAGDEHYGETFQVCVNRDKCQVHFGKEIAEREKNQKLRERGQAGKANKREAKDEQQRAKAQAKEQQAEAQWKLLSASIKKAVRAAAEKTPAALPKGVYALVLSFNRLPKTTTPAQLQKALLDVAIDRHFGTWMYRGNMSTYHTWARALGVDVKKLQAELEPKDATPAKAKKAKAS